MKAKAGLSLIVAVAIFTVVSVWALPSVKMQIGQSSQDNRQQGTISSKQSQKGDDNSHRREEARR